MWRWQRARQLRKQLHAENNMGATTAVTRDSSHRGGPESGHVPSASALTPLVRVAHQLDRRSPVTLSVVGASWAVYARLFRRVCSLARI